MNVSLVNRGKNIVTKGEIAIYEQFLLYPQCFFKSHLLQIHFDAAIDCKNIVLCNNFMFSNFQHFGKVSSRVFAADLMFVERVKRTHRLYQGNG